MLVRSLAIFAVLICASPAFPQQTETNISIDAHAATHHFPHYWEKIFGSPRAINTMRESYRTDLGTAKLATGMNYVRFVGIFNDEVGIYSVDGQGHPTYNFTYVDEIYDGLLDRGVRPFVVLGFMPLSLASSQDPSSFFFRANVSPPKDMKLWEDLIEHFAEHLITRYGIEEVSQWYFEVWNEPNTSFWAGKPQQETYFNLYDSTAKTLKRVSPLLRVGGPATSESAWVGDLIRHTSENQIPLDFVSTHAYANDNPGSTLGIYKPVLRREMVVREVQKVHDQVKSSSRPNLPIIFSEFNASADEISKITDSAFMGPWLATVISRCDGLVDILTYWSFSDSFDSKGVMARPFHGGLGMIAQGHIPKAAFNAFSLLHQLGTERIPLDSDSALATVRDDGSLAIVVWNYSKPDEDVPPREFHLVLSGASEMTRAVIYRVDREHGSALPAWEAMGKPDSPSRQQQEALREAGRMKPPEILTLSSNGHTSISLTVPPRGLALILVQK